MCPSPSTIPTPPVPRPWPPPVPDRPLCVCACPYEAQLDDDGCLVHLYRQDCLTEFLRLCQGYDTFYRCADPKMALMVKSEEQGDNVRVARALTTCHAAPSARQTFEGARREWVTTCDVCARASP